MLLISAKNLKKEIGLKLLYDGATFDINSGEKVGLIGRNGLGKTTLFKIIAGQDKEFEGELFINKGSNIVLTSQEHFIESDITVINYILQSVPMYFELKEVIDEYEKNGDIKVSLEEYCDKVQDFSDLGYYDIENKILETLNDFQIEIDKALSPLKNLSGGQKRFVELTKVMHSGADIQLIDEPTNHMDYVGKEKFIHWLKSSKATQVIVTHDRDVLHHVDRILEVKNFQLYSFNGNYDQYIRQNTHHNITQITKYEGDLKKIDKAKKQMVAARAHKFMAKSTKARTAAKIQEERFKKEFEKLQNDLNKPSFWIDKDSVKEIDKDISDSYHKYKEKNIAINTSSVVNHKRFLIRVRNLDLGYDKELFKNLNFEVNEGDRIFIKGRNGRGKTTLIKKIIEENNTQNDLNPDKKNTEEVRKPAKVFRGEIICSPRLKIGIYEQEVNPKYMSLTLRDAVREVFYDQDIPADPARINQMLGAYLFDPIEDGKLQMHSLSGGQKARFQLIKMLINKPNLLILDEPTNHLDLPSIEELENALTAYEGGIIYISHDSYFEEEIGGNLVDLEKVANTN